MKNQIKDKFITKNQYYQLVGLFTLGAQYLSQLEDLEKAALEITNEVDTKFGSHTSDGIWGNRGLDDMLKLLNIKVSK